jgi:exosome complex component RRP4
MNSTDIDACLVAPGQPITTEPGFLRGHGSFVEEITEGSQLVACVAGQIERVNKLITVKPLKSRYIFLFEVLW